MNTEHSKYTEIIEQYLDGTLSEDQKKAFEDELKSNNELLNELNYRKQLALHWSKAKTLHDTRNKVKEIIDLQKKQKKKRYTIIILAAILAGLVFVPTGIWFTSKTDDIFLANDKNNEKEYHQPDIYEPEQKAKRYEYIEPELLQPKNGIVLETPDSITFKWKPALTSNSDIEIFKQGKEKPILSKNVNTGDTIAIIIFTDIEAGQYYWSIKGFSSTKKSFEIMHEP